MVRVIYKLFRSAFFPLLFLASGCLLDKNDKNNGGTIVDKDFTPDTLLDFVKSKKIRKIEDFLNHSELPNSYKLNFLPLKDAVTLQPAALDCPRVLSYGRTSSLIYSFNCGELSSEEEPGIPNNHLEMVYHNKDIKESQTFSLNFASQSVVLHGPNPELCQECHDASEKPHIRGIVNQAFDDNDWKNFRELIQNYPKKSRFIRYKSLNWDQTKNYSRISDIITAEWGR